MVLFLMISFLKNLLILRLILLGGGDAVLELFEKAKNQKPIYVIQSESLNEGYTSVTLCVKLNASYRYVYYNDKNQSLDTQDLTFSVIDDNVIYAISFSLSVRNEELIFDMSRRERFSLLEMRN